MSDIFKKGYNVYYTIELKKLTSDVHLVILDSDSDSLKHMAVFFEVMVVL
jgi:hypothetical protein